MSETEQKDILGIEPEWEDLNITNLIWKSLNKSRDLSYPKVQEIFRFQEDPVFDYF